jgi:uncharacterized membrane protein
MRRDPVVTILLAAGALLVAVTVVGLVVLWPEEGELERPALLSQPQTEQARVVGLRAVPCGIQQGSAAECVRVTAELTTGEEGREIELTTAAREGTFGLGDRIRVFRNTLPEGATVGGLPADLYVFTDFERRAPIYWLAAVFAALVILTGRFQGLRALLGLGASLLVVVYFIVPAILEGRSPMPVAFVGALGVMLATLPLTHGFNFKTLAACLGTAIALTVTLVLAAVFTNLAYLSGLSSEEAAYLSATQGQVSLRGLLLAGMVIGALGVLDDLTVSQSSTVMALRHANPSLGVRELFKGGIGVGHDHIAATVNTLVLAYAGASLPVLLLFSLADTSLTDAINFEPVAEAIVAMLVGSIGLITAVPVTTGLAALLATRLSVEEIEAEAEHEHGHAHAH